MPKIFLAACSHVKTPVVNSGVKPHYILESFMDLKSDSKAKQEYIKWCLTADEFLLDSGAFAFVNKAKKGDSFSTKAINQYTKDYVNFINKYDIQNFFEMDLDCIFPYEKVLKARRWIESKTNKKCIPVWHLSRGMKEFHKMCKEYSYVAIGGIAAKEIKKKDHAILQELCDIAHSYGCKIHGLGYLPLQILNEDNCPFDTVDGTGWQGQIRANTFKLNNGKLTKELDVEMSSGNKSWKLVAEECYVNWTKFSKMKG